jgi:spore coat protein H
LLRPTCNAFAALLAAAPLLLLSACPAPEEQPEGWTEDSHSNDVPANHDRVFAQGVVQRLDITIGADGWAAMRDDLDQLIGSEIEPPGPPGPEAIDACVGLEENDPCSYEGDDGLVEGSCLPGPPGAPLACIDLSGMPGLLSEDPIWVPVTVAHDGAQWPWVGMRWKGNSSLRNSWETGVLKLPFRLDFDQYEDEHPETEDQRFFGFKKLTFAPGFKDPSYLRDTLSGELMRAFAVPSATTAFYEVYLDLGEGPVYAGLYTAIEDPSDAMLERWFDDDGGNLYKPDVPCGSFACFAEDSFPLKSGAEPADFEDIEALFEALHADRGDAAAWRSELEEVFDVEGFLTWLALNTVMENWDVYGWIAHNYYLYGDPDHGGRLSWMPWDQNEGLNHWDHASIPLDLDGVSQDWPLIRWLADDPSYRAIYLDEVARALELEAFETEVIADRARELQELIRPFVEAEQAPYTQLRFASEFDDSVDGPLGLAAHVAARRQAAQELLDDR